MILLYFNSWERPYEEVEDESVANVFEGFKKLFIDILSTLRIRTFRDHLGMYLFGFGAEWLSQRHLHISLYMYFQDHLHLCQK